MGHTRDRSYLCGFGSCLTFWFLAGEPVECVVADNLVQIFYPRVQLGYSPQGPPRG
jgi:hypothetical protein